ncbi:hypothetical protein C1Y30_09680 [Pseudomonas sp. GW704-F3]|nr:hypothetical protein C1Y30_09680 [Pseudomonas sp. GW704-F3]PMU95887.1 hypothetical protein C1Y28_09055 [Pseudomonas sp. GW704-F5]PMU99211.1 hypothetical protein C1Y29_25880 [Pseudomonas sp. MPBD4-3]PMV33303.1 hypothetical protein C1Y27_10780 [Pseudomonas sp. GW704-F2]RTY77396.1 hypothetical protein EKA83_12335 [Pseudomonas veronii]
MPWWVQGLIVVVIPVSPVRGQSTLGFFQVTSDFRGLSGCGLTSCSARAVLERLTGRKFFRLSSAAEYAR